MWFDRMGWLLLLLWLVVLFAYRSIAVATPVLAFGLVGAAIVLRRRAGVPSIRPNKRNALALYRWRQYRRDVYGSPRR